MKKLIALLLALSFSFAPKMSYGDPEGGQSSPAQTQGTDPGEPVSGGSTSDPTQEPTTQPGEENDPQASPLPAGDPAPSPTARPVWTAPAAPKAAWKPAATPTPSPTAQAPAPEPTIPARVAFAIDGRVVEFEDVSDIGILYGLIPGEMELADSLTALGDALTAQSERDGAIVAFVGAGALFTAQELSDLEALSPKERLFMVFTALGLDEISAEAFLSSRPSYEAMLLHASLLARAYDMSNKEKAIREQVLEDAFFFQQAGDWQSITLTVQVEFGGSVRYERYTFSKTNGEWDLSALYLSAYLQ